MDVSAAIQVALSYMTATSTVSLESRGTERMTVLDAVHGAHRGSRAGQMGALMGADVGARARPGDARSRASGLTTQRGANR